VAGQRLQSAPCPAGSHRTRDLRPLQGNVQRVYGRCAGTERRGVARRKAAGQRPESADRPSQEGARRPQLRTFRQNQRRFKETWCSTDGREGWGDGLCYRVNWGVLVSFMLKSGPSCRLPVAGLLVDVECYRLSIFSRLLVCTAALPQAAVATASLC